MNLSSFLLVLWSVYSCVPLIFCLAINKASDNEDESLNIFYKDINDALPQEDEIQENALREHAVRKRRQANTKNDPDDLLFLMTVPQDELEQIQAMADFAMQTLDLIDEDNVKRKVVKVIKAQKQLTRDGSGIMYYLWLETQDTQCPEDTSPESWKSDPPNCMNVPGPRRTCKVNLLRSWLPNRSPVNAHVVKSECDPLKSW